MRGIVSVIAFALEKICREINLDEWTNWFLIVATYLDLMDFNKERKILTKYNDQFNVIIGWFIDFSSIIPGDVFIHLNQHKIQRFKTHLTLYLKNIGLVMKYQLV